MAQEQNSTNTHNNSQKTNSKHHSKQQNVRFQQKTKKPTHGTSATTASNGPKTSRDEKRRRWAKKHRVAPKLVVKRDPAKEYISACCSLPARKPTAGEKYTAKDPETGKMATMNRGLGKWRCSGCSKVCKVSARKPETKEVPIVQAAVEQ
jgi:hypothetical protein